MDKINKRSIASDQEESINNVSVENDKPNLQKL